MKQRLFTLCVLALCIAAATHAQRPRYEKLSPMLRQLVMNGERKNAPSHQLLLRPQLSSPDSREVCAFIRITDDAEAVLARHGCRPLCHYGPLYVAMIPVGSLRALSLEAGVNRIEARPSGQVLMDSVIHQINAHAAHEGLLLPQAYTGKGVVMGVMDIGFDLTHPTFYSRDTTDYRIRAFWDQLSQDTIGSPFPVGRDYVTASDILAVGHARDGLDQTHGTHTLGTAAGSGYHSPYQGIAPESDICIVANAVGEDLVYIDSADVYKYTFATDALGFKYIFDYADRVGKPCVISFSEGSGQDFWGYDQLYYEMLDSLMGPGHIIVAAAGNQGRTKSWFRKPTGQPTEGTFLYGSGNEMILTAKSAQDCLFRFVSYDVSTTDTLLIDTREVLTQEDSVLTLTCRQGDNLLIVETTAYPSCYHPEETCYDLHVFTTRNVGLTSLSFEAMGEEADVEVFRVNGYFVQNGNNPALKAGECVRNIHSPASSPSVICVGATIYRTGITNYKGQWKHSEPGSHGERVTASSVGPTYDGRIKPDVMAPGANVISAYSSYYLENHPNAGDINWDVEHFDFNGRTYAWNSNSGTSMACPAVGGAIALWLQANPRLTPQDVLGVISRTSRHNDPTLAYPNNEWGYGEIDVYHGLLDILQLTRIDGLSVSQTPARITRHSSSGHLNITFETPAAKPFHVRIYSLSGQLLLDRQQQAGSNNYQLSLPASVRGIVAVQLDGEPSITGSQLIRL